jgi:site-specific DNA-methyltransferase (adenine-specific)
MREHVQNNSVDLIFTDPPYGIEGDTLDKHYARDESVVVPGYVDVPLAEYAKFSRDWITECERVLRPGGSIYIVSGYSNLHHILNALHITQLQEVNHLIARYSFGVSTKNKYVSSHYHVLFWQKPNRGRQRRTFNSNWKYTDQKDSYHDRLSVQELPRDYKPGEIKNKNQLSENFIMKFIMYSSVRGDTVLDCFGGGLTTGRTAVRYGRNFIGFELNKHAYDAFVPTLAQVISLPDPTSISPTDAELEKRQRLRDGWRKKRQQQKQPLNSNLFTEEKINVK